MSTCRFTIIGQKWLQAGHFLAAAVEIISLFDTGLNVLRVLFQKLAPAVCFVLLCVAGATCTGADEEPPTAEPSASIAKNYLQAEVAKSKPAAGPDLFLLPDKEGRLRQVLGFRYEDFLKVWHAKQSDETREGFPQYAIQSVDIVGEVTEQFAKLRITMQIRLDAKPHIKVPLLLGKLIVQQYNFQAGAESSNSAKPDGNRAEFIAFDSANDGYVAWLHGETRPLRTLVVDGIVPIKRNGEEAAIQLALPRAVHAAMRLHVPIPNAVGHVSSGEAFSTTVAADGGTDFRVEGILGLCKLAWKTPGPTNSTSSSTPLVSDEITVKVDRLGVRYEALLRISNLRGKTDRLQVRLPPGTQLTEGISSTEYELSHVADSMRDGSREVEIRLLQPHKGSATIRLLAERNIADFQIEETESAERTLEISGFGLVGAVRQSGTISLELEDQLQGYFDLESSVRQIEVDELPERQRQHAQAAAFSHARAEWKILVHTVMQKRQASVLPRYELELTKGDSRLHVQLDYQFTGARTYGLRIDMRGWKLTDDPLESGGAVDRDRLQETSRGLLVLPLVKSDARQIKLRFVARRATEQSGTSWPLPEPLGAFVLPGSLSVLVQPSLLVTPQTGALVGLVPQLAAVSDYVPLGTPHNGNVAGAVAWSDPLFFRSFKPRAEFFATVAQRERSTSAVVETAVYVDREQAHVTQKIRYRVDYLPLDQLAMFVPSDLWENHTLAFSLNDEPLNSAAASGEAVDAPLESARFRKVFLDLPRPLQGDFDLDVQYTTDTGDVQSETTVPLQLPLVEPDCNATAHQATIESAESLRVTLQAAEEGRVQLWTTAAALPGESEAVVRLTGTAAPLMLPMVVQLETLQQRDKTVLERAWLQTWILGSVRQDRSVFRFRTEQSTVVIRLPVDVGGERIEILLDQQPVAGEPLDASRLAIPVVSSKSRTAHTLEIRYQMASPSGQLDILRVEPVRLECRPTGAHVFWQLVLPRQLHLASEPAGLAPEFWLGWKDYRWGRQPTRFQPFLERWLGAIAAPPPPSSVNQYLFSAFEIPPVIEVVVVPQAWLVFAGSAIVFCIGLLMFYTPLKRNALFWLLLSISVLAIVATRPEIALLFMQSVLVGGTLTLATVALRRVFLGPDDQTVLATPGSSAMSAHAASTQPWSPPQETDSAFGKSTTTLQASEPPS